MIAPMYGTAVGIAIAMVAASIAIGTRSRVLGRFETEAAPVAKARRSFPIKRLLAPVALGAGGSLGWLLAGPVGAAIGAIGSRSLLRAAGRRESLRREELEETQVSELAATLAAATRAGRSVRGALEEAASEMDEPLKTRLHSALGRLETGEPLARALSELSGSSGAGNLVATLLPIHERTGGSLPSLLDDIASIVMRRVEARGQARAMTAQARASGAVLAALPIAFVGLLSGMGGDGLGDFYRTAEGGSLLAVGAALELIGFLWMRRLGGVSEGDVPA